MAAISSTPSCAAIVPSSTIFKIRKVITEELRSSRSSYAQINHKIMKFGYDRPTGDNVKVPFPVGAVKKLLKATGKLPIPEKSARG